MNKEQTCRYWVLFYRNTKSIAFLSGPFLSIEEAKLFIDTVKPVLEPKLGLHKVHELLDASNLKDLVLKIIDARGGSFAKDLLGVKIEVKEI